jgi:hypothetical protein
MLASIDENMGRLEAFLQESGLRDNTIVIFMTDMEAPRASGPSTPGCVDTSRNTTKAVIGCRASPGGPRVDCARGTFQGRCMSRISCRRCSIYAATRECERRVME